MSAAFEDRNPDQHTYEPEEWDECDQESKLLMATRFFDLHPHLLMSYMAMLLKIEPHLVNDIYDKAATQNVDLFHYWRNL